MKLSILPQGYDRSYNGHEFNMKIAAARSSPLPPSFATPMYILLVITTIIQLIESSVFSLDRQLHLFVFTLLHEPHKFFSIHRCICMC